MKEDREHLKRVVATASRDVIKAMIEDDRNLAASAIEVLMNGGPAYVHLALYGLAGSILGGEKLQEGERAGIVVRDDHGNPLSLDEADIPPAGRAAVRIIAAYVNDDHDTMAAIVGTAWQSGPEEVVDLILTTANFAVSALRLRVSELN